jgi:RNA polymerase sigma factor (sigma-70 family)
VSDKSKRNLTDQYLVEKVLRGDTNAFGQVIKNTEGLVARIIFKMINNIEDRKDLAQDIYVKAFKNLASFKFQSKLSTWIGQITYNTCINFLEKKKLVLIDTIYEENDPGDEALENLSSARVIHNEAENFIFQKELSKILQAGIEKLSPVFKTLITLFHNEELSYAEIYEITQLPEGTVKNYLFRARKALKENLLINYKKEEL